MSFCDCHNVCVGCTGGGTATKRQNEFRARTCPPKSIKFRPSSSLFIRLNPPVMLIASMKGLFRAVPMIQALLCAVCPDFLSLFGDMTILISVS